MKLTKLLIVLIWTTCSACGAGSGRQDKAENYRSSGIASGFRMYAIMHDGQLPTNWPMLLEVLVPRVWHDEELKFREFGDNKGFTNSIYEKYVFVPPGVKMPGARGGDAPQGDILFMSSMPHETESGQLLRWVIYLREGTNVMATSYTEEGVQRLFQEYGATIPAAPTMPSAIDPEIERQRAIIKEGALEQARKDGYFPDSQARPDAREPRSPPTNPGPRQQAATATNALVAVTEAPSAPFRWWLPVAVFGGLGVIGFLLFRARRRVDAPER